MEKEKVCYLIDSGMNLYIIKEKAIKDSFNKCIAPLDIVSQVGNETQAELVHELNLKYVKDLENGLISALDELAKLYGKGFDYYDELRELTNWGNYQALDFLDMFSDNEEEDK